MSKVKICGITRPEDGIDAANLGADAIGLVFYRKSPRAVSVAVAQSIVRALPPFVSVVGLFVDASAKEIQNVLASVSLDVLQFHGDESPEFCEQFGRRYLKAVRVKTTQQVEDAFRAYETASGILVDTYVPGVPGGTGEVFNWAVLPKVRPRPLVLAGGLNSANVARAVSEVAPYAVDVSGGVEERPGIKDRSRIQSFIEEVRRGNANH